VAGRAWVAHCVRGAGGFAMVAARVDTTFPRGVGTSSASRTVPTPPALYAGAARLLERLDYRGPCCLNLIERGGRFWLHDVNLRLAASVGAAVASGFDQPRLGVEAALGMPWADGLPAGRSTRYVRWDGEVGGLMWELRTGRRRAAASTLARLAGGLARPAAVVDPSPLDPHYLWESAGRRMLRVARRAAAALPSRA
jgi:predicted ATP-grasp superfamily ATP-dependent carboligase